MRSLVEKGLKRLLHGQRGFTLVEVLVALGIMSALGSVLVGTLYQMANYTSRGHAQLAVIADLRIATQWLAQDIQMAKTTDLVDGNPAVSCSSLDPSSCVVLSWTDEFSGSATAHSASYSQVGAEFRRTYDGSTHTVARSVTEVEISLQGRLITVTLTSTDSKWSDISKQFTHYFYLRPSL